MKSTKKEDLQPHTIYLLSYCPVMICATRKIAESVADVIYKNGTYRIRRSTADDIRYIVGE